MVAKQLRGNNGEVLGQEVGKKVWLFFFLVFWPSLWTKYIALIFLMLLLKFNIPSGVM